MRQLATDLGGRQVGTVGRLDLHPDLVNVVAARATLTVDLRNTDDAALLATAVRGLRAAVDEVAAAEGVDVAWRTLARFEPVEFDAADRRPGRGGRRAGRGHDVLRHAVGRRPRRPDARPGVPRRHGVRAVGRGGVSHNPAEHTEPDHLAAGLPGPRRRPRRAGRHGS